jgi:hypothetical protein
VFNNDDTGLTMTDVSFTDNSADWGGGAMYNDGSSSGISSPSLRDVTFSGNSADYGGAMYNDGSDNGTSSPNLSDVSFSENSARFGGAMFNNGRDNGTSSPSLSKVTFTSNIAELSGGAMFNAGNPNGTSNPILVDVTFSGNNAPNGGGMFNAGSSSGISSPNLTNVIFSGNWVHYGGGMFNTGEKGISSPNLTNVTFSGNSASNFGGAMLNAGTEGTSSPVVRNSILWNNQVGSSTETITDTISNINASTALIHSLTQGTGGSSNWISDASFEDGGGNIDEDPMFIEPVDPSNAPTTEGYLRLQTGSPAIDAGDNTFVAGVLTDLDGEPRIIDGNLDSIPIVDMGAYETPIDYPYDNYLPLIFR